MHQVIGGCHCGNLSYVAEISHEPSVYKPLACDCDFCTSHGAAYISDKSGTLKISVKNQLDLSRYKYGSQLAEFLICKTCGVLVGVCYVEQGHIYATINTRSANKDYKFGQLQAISPQRLSDEERAGRWKAFWHQNVSFEYDKVH